MPVVRTLHRQVGDQVRPGARITAVPTAESYGAGFGATVANVGGELFARSQANRRAEEKKARDNADRIAITSASAKLAAHVGELETDAQTKQGNDAFELPNTTRESFNKVADELAGSLTNEKQRQAFAVERIERGTSLDMTVQRHVKNERQKYDDQETKSYVDLAQQQAIGNALDPTRVASELGRGEAKLKEWADRKGMGPDATAAAVRDFRSSTHEGVINNLLENDRDQQAAAYFAEVKDQINGDKVASVQKKIDDGTLRGNAQIKSDDIWVKASGDPDKALEAARAIKDPKLRDAVEQRIDGRIAENDRRQRRQTESRMVDAANLIEKGGIAAAQKQSWWSDLSPGDRTELERYAKRNDDSEGAGVKTDLPTYYALMTQASEDPAGFAKLNLLQNISKLGKTEFKQLAELQGSIRKGDREKAARGLDGFNTNTQIFNGLLNSAGIDKDDERAYKLRSMIGEMVDARQAQSGKALTGTEIQAIGDHLLSSVIVDKGSWYWNPGGTKKQKFELLSDVPAQDRQQIEDALRARKLPINADSILDYYNRAKGR